MLVDLRRLEAERDKRFAIELEPGDFTSAEDERLAAPILVDQTRLLASRLGSLEGKKDQLSEQVAQTRNQVEGIDSQLAADRKRLRITHAQSESLAILKTKGLVQAERLQSLEKESAELEGHIGHLVSEKARLRSIASEIRLRMLQLEEEWRADALQQINRTRAKLAELDEQRTAALARMDRMVIVAPRAGTVHAMAVHTIGGVLAPGEPIMQIVPVSDVLVVRSRISPRDIDDVRVGQKVRLQFSGLNQRTNPELVGTVALVGADLSEDSVTHTTFYTADVSITADEIEKLAGVDLRPGMPADAFIYTGMRSVLGYLIDPFRTQLDYAFRE